VALRAIATGAVGFTATLIIIIVIVITTAAFATRPRGRCCCRACCMPQVHVRGRAAGEQLDARICCEIGGRNEGKGFWW
jgi:hypothetical protein